VRSGDIDQTSCSCIGSLQFHLCSALVIFKIIHIHSYICDIKEKISLSNQDIISKVSHSAPHYGYNSWILVEKTNSHKKGYKSY